MGRKMDIGYVVKTKAECVVDAMMVFLQTRADFRDIQTEWASPLEVEVAALCVIDAWDDLQDALALPDDFHGEHVW
jgi:hypothetical protein